MGGNGATRNTQHCITSTVSRECIDMDNKSAISDDPILSRLFEIEIERLYLRLRQIEQFVMLAFGVVLGRVTVDSFQLDNDLIYLFFAALPWLLVRSIRSTPGNLQNSLGALYGRIGLKNHMPGMLTRWVITEQDEQLRESRRLVRKLFRTPAGAIKFAKRNKITLGFLSVMWVNGGEYYDHICSRRHSPTLSSLGMEKCKLLDKLRDEESE